MGRERVAVRAGGDHRLFEFLAASRPERGVPSAAAATAASVAVHGGVLLLGLWGTLLADSAYLDRVPPQAESVQVVDLVPPTTVSRSDGGGERVAAKAAEPRKGDQPTAEEIAREAHRLLLLEAPTVVLPEIPASDPSALLAALTRGEYAALDEGQGLSAAQIVAVHHEASAEQLAEGAPQFVSYTEAPQLVNAEQVKRQLSREYPSYLQANGVSGRVLLWFLIDESGRIRKMLLKQSSGFKGLDRAALKVATSMRFRPAVNYDHNVAVWVVLPVLFMMADG